MIGAVLKKAVEEGHGVDKMITEVLMREGQSQKLAAKAIAVSAQTVIRWRKAGFSG